MVEYRTEVLEWDADHRRLAVLNAAAVIAAGADVAMKIQDTVSAAFALYDEVMRQDEERTKAAEEAETEDNNDATGTREALNEEHGFIG